VHTFDALTVAPTCDIMVVCDRESAPMSERDPLYQHEQKLEIVELLDERFYLREDPSRSRELEGIHARLRATLRRPSRSDEGIRGSADGRGTP
jgi:hypothetical protein